MSTRYKTWPGNLYYNPPARGCASCVLFGTVHGSKIQ